MKRTAPSWIGPWLNSIRTKKKIEARDIAAKLNSHPANIARRENGQAFDANELPAVLVAYGISPGQFASRLALEIEAVRS